MKYFSRTYMRISSVWPMVALSVEQPSFDMTDTSAVIVTETLFLVPNPILSFNPEESGFMKILRAS